MKRIANLRHSSFRLSLAPKEQVLLFSCFLSLSFAFLASELGASRIHVIMTLYPFRYFHTCSSRSEESVHVVGDRFLRRRTESSFSTKSFCVNIEDNIKLFLRIRLERTMIFEFTLKINRSVRRNTLRLEFIQIALKLIVE